MNVSNCLQLQGAVGKYRAKYLAYFSCDYDEKHWRTGMLLVSLNNLAQVVMKRDVTQAYSRLSESPEGAALKSEVYGAVASVELLNLLNARY